MEKRERQTLGVFYNIRIGVPHDTIFVRRSIVQLAGDINCGLVLSFLDSPLIDDYPYQVKGDIVWREFQRKTVSEYLCLTLTQFDLALKKLEEKGFIEKKVFHSVKTYKPTLHVRLMKKYEDCLISILGE